MPFLIISGTVGEQAAVECMRAGACDFLLKGNLTRLAAALQRELRAAQSRKTQREQEWQRRVLESARELAESENRFKSQFLANMSHELRTPLNAIIGFSELLEDDKAGPLTAKQREYVHTVLTSGHHLLNLINDILDIAKISAGQMTLAPEPTAIRALVESVANVLEPIVVQQGVTLELDVPCKLPDLLVDPLRMQQILYNLLSNGIKFTPRGGRVSVRVRVEGEHCRIEVADTGVGIRSEDLPLLFREFQQLRPPKGPKLQGTGLGLAVTKRLVELHGGEVSVESEVGKGSTFTVKLPLPPAARPGRPPGG